MILSWQSIWLRTGMIEPMVDRTIHEPTGMSYGLGPCGYDIRIKQALWFYREHQVRFHLASSVERFHMPIDVMGHVADKSSLARKGVFVQNTIIEPGWRGYLTLEITYDGPHELYQIIAGQPIAQVVFHQLDQPTARPYDGKYQDQSDNPVPALFESRDG